MPKVGQNKKQKGYLHVEVKSVECQACGNVQNFERGVEICGIMKLCACCVSELMSKIYQQTKGNKHKDFGLRSRR